MVQNCRGDCSEMGYWFPEKWECSKPKGEGCFGRLFKVQQDCLFSVHLEVHTKKNVLAVIRFDEDKIGSVYWKWEDWLYKPALYNPLYHDERSVSMERHSSVKSIYSTAAAFKIVNRFQLGAVHQTFSLCAHRCRKGSHRKFQQALAILVMYSFH